MVYTAVDKRRGGGLEYRKKGVAEELEGVPTRKHFALRSI